MKLFKLELESNLSEVANLSEVLQLSEKKLKLWVPEVWFWMQKRKI